MALQHRVERGQQVVPDAQPPGPRLDVGQSDRVRLLDVAVLPLAHSQCDLCILLQDVVIKIQLVML